jgi:hypothetical protein
VGGGGGGKIFSEGETGHMVFNSVADPHRKNADADPGKNLNADADAAAEQDADSCPG